MTTARSTSSEATGPSLIAPAVVLVIAEVVRVALTGAELLIQPTERIDPSTGLFVVSDPLGAARQAIPVLDAILYVLAVVTACVLLARLGATASRRGPAAATGVVVALAVLLCAAVMQVAHFGGSGGAPYLIALSAILPTTVAVILGAGLAGPLVLGAVVALLVVGLRAGRGDAARGPRSVPTTSASHATAPRSRVKHRYAQTGLLARTRLSPGEVLQIAEACAASQQSDFFRGIGPVTVQERNEGWLELAGMGGIGNQGRQIGFALAATPDAGDTIVRTRLTFFRTSQNRFFLVIPAGPKLMIGYHSYELFITRVKRTIEDADPSARVVISETADTLRVPAARG